MNRRELGWTLAKVLGGWAGVALSARAQTVPRMPRIGVLRWGAPGDQAQVGLVAALAAIGYEDKRSISIEWRFATSRDEARRHATDLPDMVPKHMQLLGELIPGLQRVAFLGSTEDPVTTLFVAQARKAAAIVGVSMQVELIHSAAAAAPALDAMVREKVQAVIVQPLFATSQSGPLADLLARRKLPAVTAQGSFASSGGLMAYGFSQEDLSRRAASFVDRILKGAAPASLPVEEPTSYQMVINLATAKAIGVVVPQSLLLRANQVVQ